MAFLDYESDFWGEGLTYSRGKDQPYITLVEASREHLASGYHRKRIGLNHLAFSGKSREHVDSIRDWARSAGYKLLYDHEYPHATAPDYYAVYCEDPDRIKLEVVAPR